MHKLQKRTDLDWDKLLEKSDIQEWIRIAKSVNNSSEFAIKKICRKKI